MTSVHNVELDQAAVLFADAQTIGQTVWNKTTLLIVCLILFAVGGTVIMVVVALIPLYLKERDVAVYRPDPIAFLLTYAATSNIETFGLVSNIDQLNTQLMQKLDLKGISVKYAEFSSSSIKKKRQVLIVDANECQAISNQITNRFVIYFTIDYPYGCNIPSCEKNFRTVVAYKIATLYKNLTLAVTLTNGVLITLNLSFCSPNQIHSISCNPSCKNDGTCNSNHTCTCSDGYSGVTCAIQSTGLCTNNELSSSAPILSITFGAGVPQYSNTTPASFDFTTTYYQVFSGPVQDGLFAFMNSVPGNFPTWHIGARDHTGDAGGYMLLVNANYQPDQFYNGTVSGLTVGNRYQFSVWVANLVDSSNDLLRPDVLFQVRSPSAGNDLLAQVDSGPIPEYSTMTWTKYGLSFVAETASVVLLMISNAPGGGGNDLALDDIQLRACAPRGSPSG